MSTTERSAAYPYISLEKAVVLLEKVRKGLGCANVTRDQIAPVLGHSKCTGPAGRKIAALAHYGLLEKEKDSYKISKLANKILTPISNDEKENALKEAALTPVIFAGVYERFSPDGRLPDALSAILHREYGVTINAADLAKDNLINTLAYAGVLDINTQQFTATIKSSNENDNCIPPNIQTGKEVQKDREKSEGSQKFQVYELPLSLGKARLELPQKLSKKDLATLESLFQLVKHFVDEEEV